MVIKLGKANKPRFLAKLDETSLVQLSQWISLSLKNDDATSRGAVELLVSLDMYRYTQQLDREEQQSDPVAIEAHD